MAIVFDTSVLIAAFVESHPQHKIALPWVKRAKDGGIKWAVSAHTVVECYAVLTRLPLIPKISPSFAKLLIEENIEKSAQIVSLSATEYVALMKNVANLGLSGGIIYDAITVKAAQKIKAKGVLTFNVKDFQRLSLENPDFILSPS